MTLGNLALRSPPPLTIAYAELGVLIDTIRSDTIVLRFAKIVLVGIGLLVAAYFALYYPGTNGMIPLELLRFFSIKSDESFTETYNHAIAFSAELFFLLAFFEARSRMCLFFAVLCFFIWFDDSALFHERIGGYASTTLGFSETMGLRPQDLGELFVWACSAVGLFVILIYALLRCDQGDLGLLAAGAACFGALVVFGIGVDMLSVALNSRVFGLIEDIGEMLVIAAFATIALACYRHSGRLFNSSMEG